MEFPDDLRYTNDHEWVRVEGTTAIIGITAHAASELGDIVYLDIPEDGSDVQIGATVGTIEAVKTVAELFTPVSGRVVEVNRALNDAPETVNGDCYGDGWIIKVEMTNPAEVDSLLSATDYRTLIGQ